MTRRRRCEFSEIARFVKREIAVFQRPDGICRCMHTRTKRKLSRPRIVFVPYIRSNNNCTTETNDWKSDLLNYVWTRTGMTHSYTPYFSTSCTRVYIYMYLRAYPILEKIGWRRGGGDGPYRAREYRLRGGLCVSVLFSLRFRFLHRAARRQTYSCRDFETRGTAAGLQKTRA